MSENRGDVEIETERLHLVVEAKRGWNLPTPAQLQQYADRLDERDDRDRRIAVIAECAPYYPPVQALPESLDGVPVSYTPWKRIAEIATVTAAASRSHAEKRRGHHAAARPHPRDHPAVRLERRTPLPLHARAADRAGQACAQRQDLAEREAVVCPGPAVACDTISEARDKTQERLASAGESAV
jgi:hypothetical protein